MFFQALVDLACALRHRETVRKALLKTEAQRRAEPERRGRPLKISTSKARVVCPSLDQCGFSVACFDGMCFDGMRSVLVRAVDWQRCVDDFRAGVPASVALSLDGSWFVGSTESAPRRGACARQW